MRHPLLRSLSLGISLAILCTADANLGWSQTPTSNDSGPITTATLFRYFNRQAEQIDIRTLKNERLQKGTESLLNWTIGSSWQGSYFVWTENSRPALIGCFLADTQTPELRRSFVEFHTIGPTRIAPLEFSDPRSQRWTPEIRSAGDFAWDKGPPVGTEARQRLRVYRDVARQFSVTMYSDDERSKEVLRLLSQPLYRYPAQENSPDDGAIFAFVTTNGTDPEFLLALETTGTAAQTSWTVRPMRSCTRRLELQREDQQVWSVDKYDVQNPRQPHIEPYIIVTLQETTVDDFNTTVQTLLAEPE
jgi:hypothetical protein